MVNIKWTELLILQYSREIQVSLQSIVKVEDQSTIPCCILFKKKKQR